MPEYRKPYLDACVFIGWIKGEVVNGVERGKIASRILKSASKGAFNIYTSTLTLAETHKHKGLSELTEAEDNRILTFFENDYVLLIDVDRNIGEQANKLCREYSLKPNDAIHLACALRAGCDRLLTWDDGLLRIAHPRIRCKNPVADADLLDLMTEI